MPRAISRFLVALLFFLAVSGWGFTIMLTSQVLPQVHEAPAEIEARAEAFMREYVTVQAEATRYERLEPYLHGPALDAVHAEANAEADGIDGLRYVGGSYTTLFRDGPIALVEADLVVDYRGAEQRIGEHLLFRFIDSRWVIDERWRIEIDPGTPLVEEDPYGRPEPSHAPAPSEEPGATPEPES